MLKLYTLHGETFPNLLLLLLWRPSKHHPKLPEYILVLAGPHTKHCILASNIFCKQTLSRISVDYIQRIAVYIFPRIDRIEDDQNRHCSTPEISVFKSNNIFDIGLGYEYLYCHNPTQQQLNLTQLRLDIIIPPNPPTPPPHPTPHPTQMNK